MDEEERVVRLPGWGNQRQDIDALWERFGKKQKKLLTVEAASMSFKSPKEYLRSILEVAYKEKLAPPVVQEAIEEVLFGEEWVGE